MILEFKTYEEAKEHLNLVNQALSADSIARGLTVIDRGTHKELVGKNIQTGEDDFKAMRTIAWDDIRASMDNTYYFISPLSDKRFAHLRNGMKEYERVVPEHWLTMEEETVKQGFLASLQTLSKRLLGVFRG